MKDSDKKKLEEIKGKTDNPALKKSIQEKIKNAGKPINK